MKKAGDTLYAVECTVAGAGFIVMVVVNIFNVLMRFITSNDYGHFGEMIVPAGGYGPRCSDPDSHKGDGALYCVDGPVTVNLTDAQESFVMEPEDTFFLPAGTKYQLVNFENKPVKVVFAITEL